MLQQYMKWVKPTGLNINWYEIQNNHCCIASNNIFYVVYDQLVMGCCVAYKLHAQYACYPNIMVFCCFTGKLNNKSILRQSVWARIAVCIALATGWTVKGSEFKSRKVQVFLLSTLSRSVLWPTTPPIQCVHVDCIPG